CIDTPTSALYTLSLHDALPISRSMSKISARVAVVQGRNAIGVELPNPKREKVLLREMLASSEYTDTQARLPLCLGKTIGGEPVIDRKSTRLNSSHDQISYAVFC